MSKSYLAKRQWRNPDPGYKPQQKPSKKKKGLGEFDALAPLTGKTLNREQNAYIRNQTRPLARQLNAELQASNFRRDQQIPAWFGAYQADLARLRGESQSAGNASLDRVAQFSQQGAAQDAASRAAQQQRLMADAQMRGVAYDPSADTGQIAAEDARRNLQTSVLGTLAANNQNQFNYLTNRQGIASQQGLAERMNQGARLAKIREDQRELAAKKGDLATEFRRTAREDDRKWNLENKALGGDKADRKLDAWKAKLSASVSSSNNKRTTSTSRANAQLSQREQNRRNREDNRAAKKRAKIAAKGDKKGKK